jgi:hypothetical protein
MRVGWRLLEVSRTDVEGEVTFARLDSVRRRAFAKRTLPVSLEMLRPTLCGMYSESGNVSAGNQDLKTQNE